MQEQMLNLGRLVLCHGCHADWTDSPTHGGIIFRNMCFCPDCTPMLLKQIKREGNADLIAGRCPSGVSFADFIRGWRGGDATVIITTRKLED